MNNENDEKSPEMVVDPIPSLKSAMKEAVKASEKSRVQIADEMNRLGTIGGLILGRGSRRITLPALDGWLSQSKETNVIPLRWLYIFCTAVDNNLPLQVYAEFFQGVRLVTDAEHRMLEWAKAELQARENKRQAKHLATLIGK